MRFVDMRWFYGLAPCCLLATFLTALSGCKSAIYTTSDEPTDKQVRVVGLKYYLPMAQIRLSAKTEETGENLILEVSRALVADPGAAYYVARRLNHLYDDEINIKLNADTGMLDYVSTSFNDRTGTILEDAAVVALSSIPTGAKALTATSSDSDCPNGWEAVVESSIPGGFSTTIAQADSRIEKSVWIRVQLDPDIQAHKIDFQIFPANDRTATAIVGEIDGIVARTLSPHLLTVNRSQIYVYTPPNAQTGASGKCKVKYLQSSPINFSVMLPDLANPVIVPFGRRPLTHTKRAVTLASGIVAQHEINEPSIVQGLIAIPRKIVETAVPLPLSVQLQQHTVTHLEAEAAEVEKRKALEVPAGQ